MANIKDLIDHNQDNHTLFILNSAGELGEKENLEVYVVGGFVRDLIMRKPINDIDIMIVGDGIIFAEKLAENPTSSADASKIPKLLKNARIAPVADAPQTFSGPRRPPRPSAIPACCLRAKPSLVTNEPMTR